ncbi:outer membrane protein assembly factor BamD [Flavobacterium humi]|uniref:Outer membrane protein assembly factor BamD n=1 Tax=Flavobacterium humi TaxID=2562683 RepID=A0A4Z0L878_9FLAO|nr:outer membrane protein assembly factor BamD [Flavobacterium humi]TGD58192.1 outer membrane protein assembly factor BamD [Flavobacterium humi]
MNKIIYVFLLTVLFSSCNEYQRAIKSEDVGVKFDVATKKYEAGKYEKAIRLFEQIAPAYRGKPQAEKMFYMFAQSYYKTKQYYLSGYQFESFAALYPKSEKAEEAAFLSAKSYAQLSPVYSLDQADTDKAITKLQAFINNYPNSSYMPEANELVKNLREKLEKKAFEIAKQYNTISDYKTAIKALDNFISDYPGTPFKEKALYYKLDSCYNLAINSVPAKMEERLNAAKLAYASLMKFNANTEYKKIADDMLARIDKDLQQFSK